ncbi:hypothetical protein RSOCI_02350 [Rhabdochlamydiaceae symbiont of Dictyostelium giganteum]
MSMNGTTPTGSHSIFSPLTPSLESKLHIMADWGTSDEWTDRHIKAPFQAINVIVSLTCFTLKSLGSVFLTPFHSFTKSPSETTPHAWSSLENSSIALIQIAAVVCVAVLGIFKPQTFYRLFKKESQASTSPISNSQPGITPQLISTPPSHSQLNITPQATVNSNDCVNSAIPKEQRIKEITVQLAEAQEERIKEITLDLEKTQEQLKLKEQEMLELTEKCSTLNLESTSLQYQLKKAKEDIETSKNTELSNIQKIVSKIKNAPEVTIDINSETTSEISKKILTEIVKIFKESSKSTKCNDLILKLLKEDLTITNTSQFSETGKNIVNEIILLKTNLTQKRAGVTKVISDSNNVQKHSSEVTDTSAIQLSKALINYDITNTLYTKLKANLKTALSANQTARVVARAKNTEDLKEILTKLIGELGTIIDNQAIVEEQAAKEQAAREKALTEKNSPKSR